MRRRCLQGFFLLFCTFVSIDAAEPPGLVNYQGVLRDSSGVPIDGTRDMVFRFYDTDGGAGCVSGTLLLTDAHQAVGTGGVALANGSFNVQLGSGTVTAGAAGTIAEIFRDHDAVYMEIDVGDGGSFETLCPRIRVVAAPYALNADHLDGRDSSGYLDTSSTAQTKSGNLSVQDMTVNGGDIFFPASTRIDTSTTYFRVYAGDFNGDDIFLNAGNDPSDGSLEIFGDGVFRMRSGAGNFQFYRGFDFVEIAELFSTGSLQLDGDLFVDGGDINLGPGADDDLTAADVTTLTDGGLADSLHVHAAIGDPSTGDASVSGIMGVGSHLEVSGDASLNRTLFMETTASGEPDGDQVIYFYDAGSRTGKELRWHDSIGRLSTNTGLVLLGNIQTGMSTPSVAFNAFGDIDSDAPGIGTNDDVFVNEDLEVGGLAYLNRSLIMESSASGEPDGPQSIWFYNNNNQLGDFIRWEDALDTFRMSEDLAIDGVLQSGFLGTPVGYNAFGAVDPESGAISNGGDLFVNFDLEIGASAFLNRTLYMDANSTGSADGDQHIYFYDDNARDNEFILWDDSLDAFLLSDDIALFDGSIETLNNAALELYSENSHMYFLVDSNNDTTADPIWRWFDDTTANPDRLMQLEAGGDLFIGGTIFENQTFDIAEGFLKAEEMEPGDLVAVDATRKEAVRLTQGADDRAVLGVVSTEPGIVLGGGAFSVEAIRQAWGDEVAREFESREGDLSREVVALNPALQRAEERLDSLESFSAHYLTSHFNGPDVGAVEVQEGNAPLARTPQPGVTQDELRERYQSDLHMHRQDVNDRALQLFFEKRIAPIALSGRVPVKVDAAFGEIRAGDYLAPSPVPGVAMKATRPGPIVGTALESFSGGRGKVLTFIHRGHYTPGDAIEVVSAELTEELDQRTADPETGIQSVPGHLQVVFDRGPDEGARFSVFGGGENGVDHELLRVDEMGNLHVKGAVRPSSLDLAEYHPVNEPTEVGDVLVVDLASPGAMRLGRSPADPAVVGIVSAEPGLLLGAGMTRIADADPVLAAQLDEARRFGRDEEEARLWRLLQGRFDRTHAPIALSGTVDCKVDAGYGAIRIGDLLTTSATPGHAMRADDPRPGTIIGKALEALDSGTGKVRVLVMLR
ncbi:MAG: hypothetical protein GY716_25795 [bacterium]|nr:hypothetical protein [bacterium]